MGDLAVNLAERIISLAEMRPVVAPPELEPMVAAVRAMIKKSLGALIFRNVVLAGEVLESDDLVDRYRDEIFERLLAGMRQDPADLDPNLQLVLASRYLERLADHATNIAEDIIFWVRGLDVRHGRAANLNTQPAPVTENS
jgi:phosphate transport system protein